MVLLDIKKPEKCIDCPCKYMSEGAWSNYCQITETDFEGRESFGVLENCPLKALEENRADLEFLNWCFENYPDEMQKLVHKYSKDGLWQY